MYQIFGIFCDPFLFFLVWIAAASCNLWRQRRETRRRLLLLSVPLLLLAILCTPAFSYLAMGSLEWRYVANAANPVQAPAIVVLGGSMEPAAGNAPRLQLGDNTRLRCLTAAELYYQAPPVPIVLSGGKMDPSAPGPTLAEVMRDQMLLLRVAATDLVLENRSRSTYENAVESAKILKLRGIRRVILVTDATHLWRAESCFRAQGIEVEPVGACYGASHLNPSISAFLPSSRAAKEVTCVAHEWLGMLWYWMRGRI